MNFDLSASIIQKYYRNTQICSICFSLVRCKKNDALYCIHNYHESCLEKYAKEHCPQCKKNLPFSNLQIKKNKVVKEISPEYLSSLKKDIVTKQIKENDKINNAIEYSIDYITKHEFNLTINHDMRLIVKILNKYNKVKKLNYPFLPGVKNYNKIDYKKYEQLIHFEHYLNVYEAASSNFSYRCNLSLDYLKNIKSEILHYVKFNTLKIIKSEWKQI